LRNGIRVNKYLYSDTSQLARKVAAHRLQQLSAVYPRLLPLEAWRDAFLVLPQDVSQVTSRDLQFAGAGGSDQWLVVAFWNSESAQCAQSVLSVLHHLQQLNSPVAPGCILGCAPLPPSADAPAAEAVFFFMGIDSQKGINRGLGLGKKGIIVLSLVRNHSFDQKCPFLLIPAQL
jgi:hypothetical protein